MKINKLAMMVEEISFVSDIRAFFKRALSFTHENILGQAGKYQIRIDTPRTKRGDFKLIGCSNMKKVYTFLVVFITTFSSASFAQVANLNITLSDVLSFSVTQPGSLDVNFDTEEKYTNGITALASDHVSITSSRGYIVKAVAGTVTGLASISPGTVKITSTIGATNNGNITGITYGSAVILPETGGTAATVISAANSSWSGSNSTNKFNISYLIGSGGVYAGKPTGLNVVPVVYTVTQQ